MKKIAICITALVFLAAAAYLVLPGFTRTGTAVIEDISVSTDGSEVTLCVGEASSAGYIRKVTIHQQQGGRLYLDCYRAFGGINGSWGAKESFTLPLLADTDCIALYRGNGAYQEVLILDDTGQWQPVK